jgi:hypothetical protein
MLLQLQILRSKNYAKKIRKTKKRYMLLSFKLAMNIPSGTSHATGGRVMQRGILALILLSFFAVSEGLCQEEAPPCNYDSTKYYGTDFLNQMAIIPSQSKGLAAFADLDRDGFNEMVLGEERHLGAGEIKDYMSIFDQNGEEIYYSDSEQSYYLYHLFVSDLNLDGYPEIIFSWHCGGTSGLMNHHIIYQDISGVWQDYTITNEQGLQLDDLNGDGIVELIIGYYEPGPLNTYLKADFVHIANFSDGYLLDVSKEFPEYFRDTVLPHCREQLANNPFRQNDPSENANYEYYNQLWNQAIKQAESYAK